jgi:sugar phosphate isomerase/epimerase
VEAVRAALELAGDLQRCPISLELPRPLDDESLGSVIETIAEQALRVGVELADHAAPDATSDQLGIGIDPAAQLSSNEDPAAAVTKHADRLVSARLCDLLASGMRGPIGEVQGARLDVLSYRVALSVGGYDRPVVVDARQWSDPWSGLAQTTRTWSAARTGELIPPG